MCFHVELFFLIDVKGRLILEKHFFGALLKTALFMDPEFIFPYLFPFQFGFN